MWKRVLSLILTFTMVVGMMSSMGTVVEAAGTGTENDPIVVYRNPEADYAPSESNDSMNEISTVISVLKSFEVRPETRAEWVSLIKTGANVEGEVDIIFEMNGKEISLCNDTIVETDSGSVPVPLYKLFGWKAVNDGEATEKVKIVDANGNIIKDEIVVKVKNHIGVKWMYHTGSSNIEVPLGDIIQDYGYTSIMEAVETNLPEGKKFAGWDVDGFNESNTVDLEKFNTDVNTTIDVGNASQFEGKTFTAVYAENVQQKIATEIIIPNDSVTVSYSADLTVAKLVELTGAHVKDADRNSVEGLLFSSCPIAIGTYDIVLSFNETLTHKAAESKTVTITIENSHDITENNPVVVYRNPKLDPAGTELSLEQVDDFTARETSTTNWFNKVKATAQLDNAANMQFHVNVSDVELDANVVGKTSYSSLEADLGGLFGWEAVQGKTAGEATEQVSLVDGNNNVIATNIPVKVKGHVDITWNIGGEVKETEHALGSAINTTQSYKDIVDYAKTKAPTKNHSFAGWAPLGSTEAVEEDDLGLTKVIDVTALDGAAIAAESMNGKKFVAIYTEEKILKTSIHVNESEKKLKYDKALTPEIILAKFAPEVYASDGTTETKIGGAKLSLESSTGFGVGTHTMTIKYKAETGYYDSYKNVTVIITNKEDIDEKNPVVVYRNPKKDTAGTVISSNVNELNKFKVRDYVKTKWLNKIQGAAGLDNATDMQFKVTASGLTVDAYLNQSTIVAGNPVNLVGLFGWEAVKGGTAGTASETVNLLDTKGTLIATDIPVMVKGYVDITWNIGKTEVKAKHALGSAIYKSDTYADIEGKANDKENVPPNSYFAGWDMDNDGIADSNDALGLLKVIDVIEGDDTILAEGMEGKTFTAVYQTNPVLDTYIEVPDEVEVEYSDSLTPDMILDRINPVVKDENGDKIDNPALDITCSTGIGKHTAIITYKGVPSKYNASSENVTVIIKGKVINETIVVYRNPVQDPAPKFEDLEPKIDMLDKFIVRPKTKDSWLDAAVSVAGAKKASDLQVNVTEYIEKIKDKLEEVFGTVDLDIEYVNVRGKTEFLGNQLDLGNLFGSQAVQGGIAGAVTEENVRIVDTNNKVIQDGLKFQIKGYVNVEWQYGVDGAQTLKSQIPLDNAIGLYATDGVTTDYDKARNAANVVAPEGQVFDRWDVDGWDVNGWDVNGDDKVDNEDIKALFTKTVDVFAADGTVAAKAVDGMTFKAVYKEGQQGPVVEKLATEIIPTKTEVTLRYSSDLTADKILKEIDPIVKVVNGEKIGDAKDVFISCEVAAGTQTATLSYPGTLEDYKPAKDVTVTVIIEKAKPEMYVSSHTLKYGQTVTEDKVYSANCDTIKFLAGLDVHDPQKLISKVQLALPDNLMTLVGIGVGALGQEIDLNNLTVQQLQAIIDKAEEAGTSLGTYGQYLNYLNKVEDLLDKIKTEYGVDIDLTVSISDKIEMPTAIGVYAAGMMGSDSNYESDMAAGYILITPAMTKTTLSWNATDDNFVIGLDKTASFDFTAKAANTEVNSKIEYLFIGVDSNKEFVLNRVNPEKENVSKALNAVGVYAQIAYVADFGNEMFYAEPIVRPILVSPEIADVKFVSANGDESLAEVFEYGDEISFDVTVDGKKDPKGTLYVKYAGSDITANGWYRDEVPSEPGMYTAVAVYGEKNAAGEIVKLGGAVKAFVIEKADADISMSNVTVEPDGNEHFTEISNETMTYVTIALDETENAYINIPSDIEEKLESAVKKLPAKAEVPVSKFLEDHVYYYIGNEVEVDGEAYKEALEATIQELIDIDLSGEAKAEMDVLYEAVAEKIAEYDIQATIKEKIEAGANKLNNYVTSVTPDILDDPLKKVMEAAIVIDGNNVYLDRAAAEAVLEEIIAGFDKDIEDMTTEELMAAAGVGAAAIVVDKILSQNDGLDIIEVKVDEIKAELSKIRLDDPKELAKQIIGALDDYLDEDELAKVYNQFFDALDESGYVEELVTIIEGLAEMCDADVSTAVDNINCGLDNLINVLIGKTKNGTLTKEDFSLIETYIDNVLTELKYLVEDLPDGTYYFGTNPSKEGVYNCYAINLSKHYKSEVLDAVLTIQKDEVVRIYGWDRYLTSMAICEELKERKGVDKFDTMILATGTDFADAMSATYLSYVAGAPILLINQDYAEKTVEYLNDNLKPGGKVYVIGGDGVIWDDWLKPIDTENIERLWGWDRYETNLKVLETAISKTDCVEEILVCSGTSYADCISASATKKPIFLVSGDEPTEIQKEFLADFNKNIVEFYVIGGDAAVTLAMEESLQKYGTVVDRVYGQDRYGTSYNVATKFVQEADSLITDSLIITYGNNFPDGICGGFLATTTNAAIVLAAPENAAWAGNYVDMNRISAGYILGGDGVLDNNTVADIFNITKDEIIEREYK